MTPDEEMDAWLAEVEAAQQTIKGLQDGTISPEEFDRRQSRKDARKQAEEAEAQRILEERHQAKVMGREGKGEKQNYANFCKNCFREFELKTETCPRCKAPTMTCDERAKELAGKVEVFKKVRDERTDRKKKWEMWKKTKAMFWTKTATNYSKWDYFTDSEEEDEALPPVVPKDDPQFKAMEKDIDDRNKRRAEGRKNAEKLKIQGNAEFSKGDFNRAAELYTLAMEQSKDYKSLYTNRALAYIKLGKYKKAVDDCTRILDFIEVFEKDYMNAPDMSFKAFLRRAVARKELQNYEEALEDCKQCMKIQPKDCEEAKKLLAEIESQILLKKQKVDILQKNEQEAASGQLTKGVILKEVVDRYLKMETLAEQNCLELLEFVSRDNDTKLYFVAKNGLDFLTQQMMKGNFSVYAVIQAVLTDSGALIEEFERKKGVVQLCKRLGEILERVTMKKPEASDMEELERICELLVCLSEDEKMRKTFIAKYPCYMTFRNFFYALKDDISKESTSLASILTFVSNLCYGTHEFRTQILAEIDMWLLNFKSVLMLTKSKYNKLQRAVFSLLANLSNDNAFRVNLLTKNPDFLKLLLKKLDFLCYDKENSINKKYIGSLELILGLFINLTFTEGKQEQLDKIFSELDLNSRLLQLINLDYKDKFLTTLFQRTVNLMSRIKSDDPKLLTTENLQKFVNFLDQYGVESGIANHDLRLLIKFFDKSNHATLKTQQKDMHSVILQLSEVICQYIDKDTDEQRYCNACNVGAAISDFDVEYAKGFQKTIKKLLEAVKEKTGNFRRNSAIFLAKLSRNPENLDVIRANHGIELLHSVSNQVLNK